MIRPTKYLDLRTAVVRLAAIVLEALQDEPVLPLRVLDERVQQEAGADARFNFYPALSLLFLLGTVEYDAKDDTIRTCPQPVRQVA